MHHRTHTLNCDLIRFIVYHKQYFPELGKRKQKENGIKHLHWIRIFLCISVTIRAKLDQIFVTEQCEKWIVKLVGLLFYFLLQTQQCNLELRPPTSAQLWCALRLGQDLHVTDWCQISLNQWWVDICQKKTFDKTQIIDLASSGVILLLTFFSHEYIHHSVFFIPCVYFLKILNKLTSLYVFLCVWAASESFRTCGAFTAAFMFCGCVWDTLDFSHTSALVCKMYWGNEILYLAEGSFNTFTN